MDSCQSDKRDDVHTDMPFLRIARGQKSASCNGARSFAGMSWQGRDPCMKEEKMTWGGIGAGRSRLGGMGPGTWVIVFCFLVLLCFMLPDSDMRQISGQSVCDLAKWDCTNHAHFPLLVGLLSRNYAFDLERGVCSKGRGLVRSKMRR